MNEYTRVILIWFLVTIVIFLLFREVFCWYWKINVRLSAQRKTSQQLQRLNTLMADILQQAKSIEQLLTKITTEATQVLENSNDKGDGVEKDTNTKEIGGDEKGKDMPDNGGQPGEQDPPIQVRDTKPKKPFCPRCGAKNTFGENCKYCGAKLELADEE